MDNRYIGIFDSGVGGLTVAAEVMKAMPGENIIYFGDTARVPYGSKPRETVTEYGREIIKFLISKGAKLIVIACGTISSNSYDTLAHEFDIPMIEMVSPGVEAAVNALDRVSGRAIGVLGTESTICSGIYEKLILDKRPELTVHSRACPLFVPLAEEGWIDNDVTRLIAEIYIKDLNDTDIDVLLLACTHYPLLTNSIRHAMRDTVIVNPAESIAIKVKSLLETHNMTCGANDTSSHKFYVSGGVEKFTRICELILGRNYQVEIATCKI